MDRSCFFLKLSFITLLLHSFALAMLIELASLLTNSLCLARLLRIPLKRWSKPAQSDLKNIFHLTSYSVSF
jgi:hypothetical protein